MDRVPTFLNFRLDRNTRHRDAWYGILRAHVPLTEDGDDQPDPMHIYIGDLNASARNGFKDLITPGGKVMELHTLMAAQLVTRHASLLASGHAMAQTSYAFGMRIAAHMGEIPELKVYT